MAIVNFDGAPVDPQVLQRMAEQCAYRGPDGIRYWIKGNVGLAHLALHATQESLREEMPMLSADGRLCLTADARVDNRPELIEALKTRGQPFPPDPTDADLIMAAYQAWGETCPGQIIGDYAFAIWDEVLQRLFCARDVYGVKSLHYTRAGATLCVASEAQQIIQHPAVPRILDEVTVADFLVRNYNDEGRTMFKDVWAVRRAHALLADPASQRQQRYWDIDPNFRITCANDAEYAARFLEIFTRCVADRLRTPHGTNIGITMSGGMDSTSVAAVAQKLLTSRPGSPHLMACTYAFETLKECDETEYSRAMADELGIDLTYIPAEQFWYLDDDQAFTPSLETPFMDGESVTGNILGIFKRRAARVWLTGHGGDNLLVGSRLTFADRLASGDFSSLIEISKICKLYKVPFLKQIWLYREWFLKPLMPEFFSTIVRCLRKSEVPDWLTADFVRRTDIAKRIVPVKFRKRFAERAHQANYDRAVKVETIQSVTSWVERQSAHQGLEARHPILDRRLVEFLLAIPSRQLFRVEASKFILREAMRRILPEIIRSRPDKTEFASYIGLGLRQNEVIKIKKIFSDPFLNKINMVKFSELSRAYEQYIVSGKKPDAIKTWLLIRLELWLKNYYSLFYQGDHYEGQ